MEYNVFDVRICKLGTYLYIKWEYLNKVGFILGKFQVLANFFGKLTFFDMVKFKILKFKAGWISKTAYHYQVRKAWNIVYNKR